MSTILDALRKVERERDANPEHELDTPTLTPEVRRRRRFPFAAVALCAAIGFSGGAVLSWWMPGEEPIEIAALPVPPPPPEIPVPRAPARAQPKPQAPVAVPAVADQAPAAPPVAAPAPGSLADASPPLAAPPAPPAAEPPAAVPAPPAEVVVAQKVPEPATIDAARPLARERGTEVLAALEKPGSALEPSPFSATREATRDLAPPVDVPKTAPPVAAPKAAPAAAPPVAAPAPPPPRDRAEEEIAAIAPAVPPEVPALDEAAPAETEPEAPAETLVDTGRSPPGAPKVALSFLQWSADPARRFAFISIDGAPTQRVHEGEIAAGLTVAAITPTGVQFKREGTTFVIRPRH